MNRGLHRWLAGIAAVLALASCKLGMDQIGDLGAPRGLILASGASLITAKLTISVNDSHLANLPMEITVHPVTTSWEESTVTWNSFHAGDADNFDPTVGTIQVTGDGWYSIDVTPLLADWLSGARPNHGVLLQAALADSGLVLDSSQDPWGVLPRPTLTVTYSSPDAGVVTVDLRDEGGPAGTPVAAGSVPDATIMSNPEAADTNFGNEPFLFVGVVDGNLKQSLIRFDFVQAPLPSGTTRTIGYWKNHAGFGPQLDVVTPLLPVMLGTGEGASVEVLTAAKAVDIFKMKYAGGPSNGIVKLCAQLLAAKLNIGAGASGAVIAQTIADADAFLADHAATSWKTLTIAEKSQVLEWAGWLDAYNNGIIGPGHDEG